MPFNPGSNVFSRIWKFVDHREERDLITRADLDIALDDLAQGINQNASFGGAVMGNWAPITGSFPPVRPDGSRIKLRDLWIVEGNGTVDGVSFLDGDFLIALNAGGGVSYAGNWIRISEPLLSEIAEGANQSAQTASTAASNAAAASVSAASSSVTAQAAATTAALYAPAYFNTLADLLANATVWTTGQRLNVRENGWCYAVVAPATTDQHLLTNGGVKISPLPQNGFVTAQQCNISTSGDQTSAVQGWLQWAIDNGHGFDLGGATFTVSQINLVGDATLINGGLLSNKAVPAGPNFQDDVAFQFGGTEAATLAVASDFEAGDNRLVLASVAGIVVGDLLHVNSSRLIDTDHRGNWQEGQIVKVMRIDGATVHVHPSLCYSGRANTAVTGTISAISADRYTLTVNNVLAGNGRDRTAKISITSGASVGEFRYAVAASATTLRHSGSIVGEWDRLPWPAGVQVGNTYEHAWKSTVTIIKSAHVTIRDMTFSRAATFNATAGDIGFRGLRLQYCDTPVVERCTVTNFSATNIHVSKSYRPLVTDCEVSGANLAHGTSSGTGYGVSFEICSEPVARNVWGKGCRRIVDFSGSSGYSENGVCDNVAAYAGGRTYEGLEFWPVGTQQQSVAGSHGSGRFTEYRNCAGFDTFLGLNLRGRTETVSNYRHFGFGTYAVNINYGCGHVIDGVSYSDRFTEENRSSTFRQTISSSGVKRLEAVVFIDWADPFVGNVLTTIRNVRASSVARCGILSSGTGAAIKHLVCEDWHMTASQEGTAYTEFVFMVTSGSATLNECYFSNINFTLASGAVYSGVTALFGIPQQHEIAAGGKIRIDDTWVANIAPNGVVRFPCRQNIATVDLINVRTGATRPRCSGLIVQDSSATTLNVSADKTNLDVLATYPTNGSGVTAGNLGVHLSATNGFLSVASNSAGDQTFKVRIM